MKLLPVLTITLTLLCSVLAGPGKGKIDPKIRKGNCKEGKLGHLARQYERKCSNRGFQGTIGCPYDETKDPSKIRSGIYRTCQKMDQYRRDCGHVCKADGNWGEFGPWSEECSAPCGGGVLTRTRQCDSPAPTNGGKECEGNAEETQECNPEPCPVDGNWGEFGPWSEECSESCGGGVLTRSRLCDSPAAAYGGLECEGSAEETQACNTQPCPVDGNWGEFGPWSEECSEPCGGGVLTRSRQCDSPAAAFGGKECEGDGEETQECNPEPCPIDGNWGEFGPWGECDVPCGDGSKTRERVCNAPAPQFGGQECEGDSTETTACWAGDCATDGNWGDWESYGRCSKRCAGGVIKAKRKCDNPAPSDGGADCEGDDKTLLPCNEQECTGKEPVDGNWGDWGSYGRCSKRCGGGLQTAKRKCNNPAPRRGGYECETEEGGAEKTQPCNEQKCTGREPVDGNWGPWMDKPHCHRREGVCIRRRYRKCDDPKPAKGGFKCGDDNKMIENLYNPCDDCGRHHHYYE